MTARKLRPVTVVVPLFNEAEGIPQLADALIHLRKTLAPSHAVHFVLVDDGSTDGTGQALLEAFGDWQSCDIVRHSRNQGIAAAMMTGLKVSRTEVVCSIDADCTYDPFELAKMIPLLTPGVDLVTASPYHPRGEVRNVPGWRLLLSKGASFLYRRVTGQNLHTFTSCCRVYRRRSVVNLPVRRQGFHGVAELLALVALRGGRIVEHPAVLDIRRFGQSKMKIVTTILGHLELLAQLWLRRVPSAASDVTTCESFPRQRARACDPVHLQRTTA